MRPPARGSEPIFNLPAVVMGLAALLILVELAASLVLDAEGNAQLSVWFGFIPQRFNFPEAIPGGALPLIWTSVTHALLHAGWEHLLLNVAWLAIFGTPVARRYGASGFLIIFALSSIAGALAFTLNSLDQLQILVGASGGIAGLTGAAVRFMFQPVIVATHPETGERVAVGRKLASFAELMADPRSRFFTLIWLLINAAMPLIPFVFGGVEIQIAWEAHLGGFVAGMLLVGAVEWFARKRVNRRT